MPLRAPRHFEATGDVELGGMNIERRNIAVCSEDSLLPVQHGRSRAPAVPELPDDVDDLACPHIPLRMLEESPASEVLTGERVRRGHQVPGRPAVGEVVERRELFGQLVRFVECGVDRARQTEVGGGSGEGLEHREGVGTTDDVEIMDTAAVFTQAQSLGQEEEVELTALRRLGEVHERREIDLTLGVGVGPDGGVVDPREMGGQMDLLADFVSGQRHRSFSSTWHSGWRGGPSPGVRAVFPASAPRWGEVRAVRRRPAGARSMQAQGAGG